MDDMQGPAQGGVPWRKGPSGLPDAFFLRTSDPNLS